MPSARLLSLLGLALTGALIAANLLYAGLVGRPAPLTGRPGDLLYATTFDGFYDEWEVYAGQQSAQIHDGRLELLAGAPQTAAWLAARPHFADFDARLQATASAGPIDNAFGIVFHLQERRAGGCDLPAVLLCGIEEALPLAGAALRQALGPAPHKDYFAFLISSDGYYSLWRAQAGATQLLSAWIEAPQIQKGLGASNQIGLRAEGGSYRFFINGALVPLCLPDGPTAASTYYGGECIGGKMQEEYRAAAALIGKIGFIAQSTASGGGGLGLHFDNLLVFYPAAPEDGNLQL